MSSAVALLLVASLGQGTGSENPALRYNDLKSVAFSGDAKVTAETRLRALEDAVKIYDGDGDVWWQLGQSRLAAKQYQPAIEACQRAIKLGAFANKFKAVALYDIARAYTQLGDKENGYAYLKQSMDAGYRNLAYIRADSDLEPLHADKRWHELAATKDVTKMTRDQGWRYDLWLMNREVTRIHFNPYTRFTKKEEDAWVKQLDRNIPKLNDDEIRVAFMKYMRRLNDGHTGIRPSEAFPTLPIQLYWFKEGLFVIAADPKYASLVGCKVLSIAGKPVEKWMSLLEDIAPRDNSQGLLSAAPRYLTMPAVLHGLGQIPDDKSVTLTVQDAQGRQADTTLTGGLGYDMKTWTLARDGSPSATPLYLKDRQRAYWFEPLPDLKAVYFQYNAVRNDSTEDTAKFAARMFDYIEKNDVQRLIVDVRWNGGGNSFLNLPFINGLIACKKIRGDGRLFVITGRQTFSAAQNFTTDIGRALEPIYVGEPTGSSPNFTGESIPFTLPYSKMTGTISDLHWQRSWPMDHRTWIAPDLPSAPTFEAFRANVDPAMEAIRAYVGAMKG